MAHEICVGMWIKITLDDLEIETEKSMRLYYDNNSMIIISHYLVQHDKTKHIDIDGHFIQEKSKWCLITNLHIPSIF